MAFELSLIGQLRIVIARQTRIDGLPAGGRLIGEAESVELDGAGIRASMAGACSDWLTLHPDGSVSVDARLLLATAGGSLSIRYTGRAAALPATGAAIHVAPVFETDDPELRWLNTVQAAGVGRRAERSLVYELYRVN